MRHLPGHTLGHRLSLKRVNKTDIIEGIFSDLNWMKLEISNTSKTGAFTNMWKLNPVLINSGSKKKSQGKLELKENNKTAHQS